MRTNDRSAWWYETDDGRFRISGHGENCAKVTVKVMHVGAHGDHYSTESEVSVDELRELMVAASQHMTSPKREGAPPNSVHTVEDPRVFGARG